MEKQASSKTSVLAKTIAPVKKLFVILKGKFKAFTKQDWIVFGLWMATLALMFVFIGVVAGVDKADKTTYTNAAAASGLVLALVLFSAIGAIVITRYRARHKKTPKNKPKK